MAQQKIDLRATWPKAIFTFLLPIFLFLSLRWFVFEPYVIPSGSMIPSLLEHDNILVSKWTYGFRLPFSERWLIWWHKPQPGEIAVFRYPLNDDIYYVKRIVATEGDEVELRQGQLFLNGQLQESSPSPSPLSEVEDGFDYFHQTIGDHSFIYRRDQNFQMSDDFGPFKVPLDHFFVMGDNRDHSSDSRVWESVPYQNLMGRPLLIWLSCNETLPHSAFICDPSTLRTQRIGLFVK